MKVEQRKKYSREFKEEAVKLVIEQGYKISEAARNLGIHANVLGRWKREMERQKAVAGNLSGVGGTQVLEAELKRLRRENERLQMEREILKKAAAFFAKESE